MMAYAKIHETFWDDPVIRGLSESARYLMLYLLTCRHRNRLGCYVLDCRYAGADLDWPADQVRRTLAELEDAGRVGYDDEHRVVFVRRFLAYNTLENAKVATGAKADLASLPDTKWLPDLLAALEEHGRSHYAEILDQLRNRIANRKRNGSETVSDTVGGASRSRSRSLSRSLPQHLNDSADAESAGADCGKLEPSETEPPPGEADTPPPTDKRDVLSDEVVYLRRLMPVLREAAFHCDATDGSILKALVRKRVEADETEAAVRGLALLRDRGRLAESFGVAPGERLSMKLLYSRDGGAARIRPIWRDAADEWARHVEGRRPKHGAEQLGAVLRGALAKAG